MAEDKDIEIAEEPKVLEADAEEQVDEGESFSLEKEEAAMKSEEVEKVVVEGPEVIEDLEAEDIGLKSDRLEEENPAPREKTRTNKRRSRGGQAPNNAEELFLDELLLRAEDAEPKLRAQLTGTIIVELKDLRQSFIFDWSSEKPKIEKTDSTTADCIIHTSEEHILSVSKGDLNPQIGMLSDKISVEGNVGLAVYFFNLVVN